VDATRFLDVEAHEDSVEDEGDEEPNDEDGE
jgi:hypothetical protein